MSSKKDLHFNDPSFIEALRVQNSDAISRIVHAYTDQIFRASLGMGFDERTSEELVQRVWSTFFEAVVHFQGKSHIRTYLFGILYNKASELRREVQKMKRTDPIDDIMEAKFQEDGHWKNPPMDPEEFMVKSQTLNLIEECMNQLPLSQKLAFSLKELDDLTTSEICKILNVSVTNLGVLLYRAKNRLRLCIESKSY